MRTTLFIIFCLLPLVTLSAGGVSGHVSNVELSAVAWEKSIRSLSVVGAERSMEWMVPAFRRSAGLTYSGKRRVEFLQAPQGQGEEKPHLVAEVELPYGAREVLLLFFPRSDGTYKVIPLANDNTGDYTEGHARVFNASTRMLAVKANEEMFSLPPGSSRIVPGDGRKIKIKAATEIDGTWRLAVSNLIELSPQQRRSIFLVESDAACFDEVTEHGEVLKRSLVKLVSVED
ncbi:MAG: hypothetical protein Q7Q73_08840 [Verrucomicrobiota bacterium JB024]|nr:hypothetical protein [Verrucomicrobiota bacterium JB024]